MGILLAFAPFIVFAIVARFVASVPGLIAGAVVSLALLLREWRRGRSPKILEMGTAILFTALALFAVFFRPAWSISEVRLRVDGGLLLIVLLSIAVRQPFTLQYAREQVPREFWNRPEFRRSNDLITAVWALAFALLVASDATLVYVPNLPPAIAFCVTILALGGAYLFTSWYPKHLRAAASSGAPLATRERDGI